MRETVENRMRVRARERARRDMEGPLYHKTLILGTAHPISLLVVKEVGPGGL